MPTRIGIVVVFVAVLVAFCVVFVKLAVDGDLVVAGGERPEPRHEFQ